MAIYEYFQIRFNTGTGFLEMNTGFETWVQVPGTGVINVNAVQNVTQTPNLFATSSQVFQNTTFGVTITPSSLDAKIRVTFPNVDIESRGVDAAILTIFRGIGGVDLGATNGNGLTVIQLAGDTFYSGNVEIIDTPNTTSPVTYQLYAKAVGGPGFDINGTAPSKMLAMAVEIH